MQEMVLDCTYVTQLWYIHKVYGIHTYVLSLSTFWWTGASEHDSRIILG